MSDEYSYVSIAQDNYEGSSEGYRLEQRGLLNGKQDDIASRELKNLLARSHHAVRNNGIAAAAKIKYRTQCGAISVVWKNTKGEPHKRMQALWDKFSKDPNLDGYGSLANTQDSWNASMFEAGESFTRLIIKRRDGHTVPLMLQTIPSEMLDVSWNPTNNENIRNSIEFEDSRPKNYHFLEKFPSGGVSYMPSGQRKIVPADEILHMFDREQPGQWRGVPKLSPVLLSLYGIDDLTDATVSKQQAAQAVSWIVKNTNMASAVSLGTTRATTDASDVDENGNVRKITQSGSAHVQYLNKGEDLILSQGSDIGVSLDPLVKSEMRKICQAVGLSYEHVSGDLSGISFSSLKFVINEMKSRIDFIYQFFTINLGLQPLCDRFQDLAKLYSPYNLSTATATFEFPMRYGVDQLKDIQADLLEVSSGFATLESKLVERNVTFEEIVADKVKREGAGLFLEPTPQSTNTEANTNSAEV